MTRRGRRSLRKRSKTRRIRKRMSRGGAWWNPFSKKTPITEDAEVTTFDYKLCEARKDKLDKQINEALINATNINKKLNTTDKDAIDKLSSELDKANKDLIEANERVAKRSDLYEQK